MFPRQTPTKKQRPTTMGLFHYDIKHSQQQQALAARSILDVFVDINDKLFDRFTRN